MRARLIVGWSTGVRPSTIRAVQAFSMRSYDTGDAAPACSGRKGTRSCPDLLHSRLSAASHSQARRLPTPCPSRLSRRPGLRAAAAISRLFSGAGSAGAMDGGAFIAARSRGPVGGRIPATAGVTGGAAWSVGKEQRPRHRFGAGGAVKRTLSAEPWQSASRL